DVADVAPDGGVGGEVVAADDGSALGGFDEGGEHPHRRGLAGPVGAEEAEDLSLLHGEVDAADGLDLLAAGLEDLLQPLRLDEHGYLTGWCPRRPGGRIPCSSLTINAAT